MTLNANQKRAIAAILNCGELRQAAKEAGVAESTIYRWVNEDEDFKAALVQALGEAIKASVLMLAGNGAKVAEVLIDETITLRGLWLKILAFFVSLLSG